MTDDNSNSEIVDIDDNSLASFEKDFLETEQVPEKPDETEVNEVEDTEEDALATEEDTDASDEEDESSDEPSEETDEEEDESDEEEDEPEPKQKSKGKNKKSYQQRINELTRERREAERMNAELLRRLEALETREREVSKQEPIKQEQLPQGAPKPDATNEKGEPLYPLGEFDPAFIRDYTKFTIAEETKAIEDKRATEAAQAKVAQEKEAIKSQWIEKVGKAEEEIPELREHIADLVDEFQGLEPAYGEYIATTIMLSENGPAIMEYLSQNIGEAQKIVASGAHAATIAIGRLDALLSKKDVRSNDNDKRNKKVSTAKEPPEQVTRGRKGQSVVRADTNDLAAFEREFLK